MSRVSTSGGPCFKVQTYRSRELLRIVGHAPFCMACGQRNDGTVVACHANSQKFGKGRSLKAHDWAVCAMCFRCHAELDQGAFLSRQQREEMWMDAYIRTLAWLFESGHVGVIDPGSRG